MLLECKNRPERGGLGKAMSEGNKDVDLDPHEWKSERDKPKEPFFGDGWPEALAYAIGFLIVSLGVHYLVVRGP